MNITFSCLVCGKEFIPVRLAQKYCSLRCKNRADKNDRRFSGIRDYIIDRDKYKCVDCGTKSKLVVHHQDWIRTNNDPSNLVTLCTSCHRKRHFDVIDNQRMNRCRICDNKFHPMRTKRDIQFLCRRKSCHAEWKKIQKRSAHEAKLCVMCGKSFMQKHSRHMTCSAECSKALMDKGKAERYIRLRDELLDKQKLYYREHAEERKAYTREWSQKRKINF